MHKLTNSEYIFEKDYTDTQKRELKTKITLHIDHISGTYKVTPGVGTRGEFGFVSNSKNNYQLWYATAALIQEAISYAEEIVNPVQDIADIIENLAEVIEDNSIEYKEHE